MCFYVQQFRDAALEVLSCGRYIPHVPTSVSINMHSLNRKSRLTSLSRNVNAHSKVLPLWLSLAKKETRSCHGCRCLLVPHQGHRPAHLQAHVSQRGHHCRPRENRIGSETDTQKVDKISGKPYNTQQCNPIQYCWKSAYLVDELIHLFLRLFCFGILLNCILL